MFSFDLSKWCAVGRSSASSRRRNAKTIHYHSESSILQTTSLMHFQILLKRVLSNYHTDGFPLPDTCTIREHPAGHTVFLTLIWNFSITVLNISKISLKSCCSCGQTTLHLLTPLKISFEKSSHRCEEFCPQQYLQSWYEDCSKVYII